MQLERLFLRISILFTLYVSTVTGLAVFGYYNRISVVVSTAVFLAVCMYFIIDLIRKAERGRIGRVSVISFVIIVAFCLIIGFFHHDLPTGRDDLSYIFASHQLVESHSLQWDDYFSRPVHGVRNLEGDTFTSQFLPTYVAYLAVYNLFGGLEATMWGNVLLLFLTFGIFYYLLKSLAGRKASIIGILLLLSSYVFFWFPKRTNSENISIFLIWLGVWLAVLAIKNKKTAYLLLGLVPFSLLLLTRPEGVIFFTIYCLVAIYLVFARSNKLSFSEKVSGIFGLAFTITNLLLFYFYISKYEAGYIVAQAVDVFEGFDFIYQSWKILISFVLLVAVTIILWIKFAKKIEFQKLVYWLIITFVLVFEAVFMYSVASDSLKWLVYRTQYVLENFVFYFYFIYILIILFGLKKKLFTRQEFFLTLILLPAFFFIIEPNIALDQPWFMRRFYPTLIPLFAILSAVILTRLNISRRNLRLFIMAIVLIGIISSRSIYIFVENRGLRDQIESFNQIFPENSLVVMNPGWNWQKVAVLQHYFYDIDAIPNIDLYRSEEMKKELLGLLLKYPDWQTNDDDLLAIINWQDNKNEQMFVELLNKYSQVYITTSETVSNLFRGFDDSNLQYVDSYLFKYDELNRESNITGYIQQTENINVKKIRNLQNRIPPSTISSVEVDLKVYQVKDTKSYIPYEYVLEVPEDVGEEINYVVLEQDDLSAHRKSLQSTVRNTEVDAE